MYRERPARSAVLGAARVWRGTAGPGGRILPDGCMDLLWDGACLTVAGPDRRAFVVPDTGRRVETVGVRFEPGVGPAVFGVRADELTGLRVPLADLWSPRAVREPAERLGSIAPGGRTGDALEAFAARLLARSASPPPAWRREAVAALGAGLGVAATARRTGLGERQFRRWCTGAFGYGPKTLGRILRLQRALRYGDAGVPAASVAALAGYADQAHLARDVRDLAGVPWSRLRRDRRPAGGAS
ncbi:helix-turn-helix domain-containing protein [Streptomyces sp. RFCAC02]|uniref:helix-turn-helix domain-containing protein n=1 Tax=Streptomyces sp. RFCAC02 TaxID=2499143 RepID=UPI0010217598|nr:helix-turn-helix domain-containing protein [Streptomyces sp. RFCAC02]